MLQGYTFYTTKLGILYLWLKEGEEDKDEIEREREREEESISEERSPNKSSAKFFRYLFEAASLKVANEKKAADGLKLTLIKY